MELKKAVILTITDDEKFLPLSRVVAPELWPLVDRPSAQYSLEEAKVAGIEQFIFAIPPEKKNIPEYFKHPAKTAEKLIKEESDKLKEWQKNIIVTIVLQKKALGDGHAILKTEQKIRKEPFAVVSPREIVDSATPCLAQLWEVFRTCQRPVLALRQLSSEDGSSKEYVGVEVEKIAHRFFKVKKIVSRPAPEKGVGALTSIGRMILIPEVFDYLKRQKPNSKGQITLVGALRNILNSGKLIYGYEFKGNWLGLYDKSDWLKANSYLSLKHPRWGEEIKKYLKEIK